MASVKPNDVNGLDLGAMRDAFQAIGAQEGAQHAPKSARIRWMGGFKLKAHVRNHTFLVDEPSHLTGDDEAPNAVEYVLGALGACYATGFVLNASLRGIELYNLEVALDATQENVFTFLRLSEEGHPGFNGIIAKLYVQSDADPKLLQEVWEDTIRTSPVGNSLARQVPIKPELSVV